MTAAGKYHIEVLFMDLSKDEEEFLRLANDPQLRQDLLARLEKLGLLSAFLQAESETTQ